MELNHFSRWTSGRRCNGEASDRGDRNIAFAIYIVMQADELHVKFKKQNKKKHTHTQLAITVTHDYRFRAAVNADEDHIDTVEEVDTTTSTWMELGS